MKQGIIDFVKRHETLHCFTLYIRNWNKPDLYKLLHAYYSDQQERTVLIAKHLGGRHPEKMIYYISFSSKDPKEKKKRIWGFFALMRRQLELINYAEHFGLQPVIKWGDEVAYYDKGMESQTYNAFEYYFQPLSGVSYSEIPECANVIRAEMAHGNFFLKHSATPDSYRVDENDIQIMASMYKKYIRLNAETEEYISEGIDKILSDKKTLGVHIRGTDFKQGLKYHPKAVPVERFIEEAKKQFVEGGYERIFLATEDIDVLNRCKQEFGDQLFYYDDVKRSAGDEVPHFVEADRPLHHYKLGLEVLRDAYTLANCDSLIVGLTSVGFAARYINVALDKSYRNVTVLNNGIHSEDFTAHAKETHKRFM